MDNVIQVDFEPVDHIQKEWEDKINKVCDLLDKLELPYNMDFDCMTTFWVYGPEDW